MLAFDEPERAACQSLITLALREDLGRGGDLTSSAFIDNEETGVVQIVARQPGVLAGLPAVELVFDSLAPDIIVREFKADGSTLAAGDVVAEVEGNVRMLLAGERTALNFVTYLSGIASATQRYVAAVAGGKARVFDTRKTLPGWRVLAKYAVRAGGGRNHRMGLFDAVLIKDNHLAAWKQSGVGNTIAGAIRSARAHVPAGTVVEVEVDTLAQLEEALAAAPDIVLLDNMTPHELRSAAALRDARAPSIELEASGGVTLATIAEIASTGIERISVGALTHSVIALDLGFDWKDRAPAARLNDSP